MCTHFIERVLLIAPQIITAHKPDNLTEHYGGAHGERDNGKFMFLTHLINLHMIRHIYRH